MLTRAQDTQVLFVGADMAFGLVEDVKVLCQSRLDPSDASWDAWIDWSALHPMRKVLVTTRGGAPAPAQRRRLAERRAQAGAEPEIVALLTDSSVLRGVLTAMSWITGNAVKAFKPDELMQAVAWLGVAEHSAELRAAIDALYAAIDRASKVA